MLVQWLRSWRFGMSERVVTDVEVAALGWSCCHRLELGLRVPKDG